MTAEQCTRLAFERVADGDRAKLARFWKSNGPQDHYLVNSASDLDRAYVVTVTGGDRYECNCPARHHFACWHRAAVATVRANRRAAGLPAAGPTLDQLRVAEPRRAALDRDIRIYAA